MFEIINAEQARKIYPEHKERIEDIIKNHSDIHFIVSKILRIPNGKEGISFYVNDYNKISNDNKVVSGSLDLLGEYRHCKDHYCGEWYFGGICNYLSFDSDEKFQPKLEKIKQVLGIKWTKKI